MYNNLSQVTNVFETKARNIAYGDSAWIFKGMKSQLDENNQLVAKLDEIIGKVPYSDKVKLKTRFKNIVPDNALQYVREYDDQFLEALVEILGWGWLGETYSRHTPCFTIGTPDLLVKDGSNHVIAAMECRRYVLQMKTEITTRTSKEQQKK